MLGRLSRNAILVPLIKKKQQYGESFTTMLAGSSRDVLQKYANIVVISTVELGYSVRTTLDLFIVLLLPQ